MYMCCIILYSNLVDSNVMVGFAVRGYWAWSASVLNWARKVSTSPGIQARCCSFSSALSVTVSPSPQSKDEENEKLHELRRYARDFRRQHTTDAERFNWDSDDEDYGLAIGRLVVT
jgi:hypothetical protein